MKENTNDIRETYSTKIKDLLDVRKTTKTKIDYGLEDRLYSKKEIIKIIKKAIADEPKRKLKSCIDELLCNKMFFKEDTLKTNSELSNKIYNRHRLFIDEYVIEKHSSYKLPYGKHAGKDIEDVISEDCQYIKWLYKTEYFFKKIIDYTEIYLEFCLPDITEEKLYKNFTFVTTNEDFNGIQAIEKWKAGPIIRVSKKWFANTETGSFLTLEKAYKFMDDYQKQQI